MADQVVAVDEMISCARDVLSGNIIPTLREFVRQSPYAFADDLDAAFQRGRRRPICQEDSSVWAAHNVRAFSAASRICESVIRGSRRLMNPRRS